MMMFGMNSVFSAGIFRSIIKDVDHAPPTLAGVDIQPLFQFGRMNREGRIRSRAFKKITWVETSIAMQLKNEYRVTECKANLRSAAMRMDDGKRIFAGGRATVVVPGSAQMSRLVRLTVSRRRPAGLGFKH